jgi:hypothetical protein
MTITTPKEIVFLVEEDPEEGYTARAMGEAIFTQANDMNSLKEMIKDAVLCHFDDPEYPLIILV